jgi:hypothetical protein
MRFSNNVSLQFVDLREEIREYERENRVWPRSGSVSKPMKRSCEPETEGGYYKVKFAVNGEGKPVGFNLDVWEWQLMERAL